MKDFLAFRRMLMPVFIHLFFWIGSAICIFLGVYDLISGKGLWGGLEILILGPIAVRLISEFFILFFRMNETLTDIKNGINRIED